jgi:hypothetical protein
MPIRAQVTTVVAAAALTVLAWSGVGHASTDSGSATPRAAGTAQPAGVGATTNVREIAYMKPTVGN